jgi:uncharacterized protein YhaN
VRFLRLQAVVFGPLEQREFGVDSDIVLVHGRNEAGKSSFRAAIETILYGFKPADRELHPLAQWNPGAPQTLHVECELRLDTGERLGVQRVLQSSARLCLADEGSDFLGPRRSNQALRCVEWLSREVFSELYSLELGQLCALDERSRADIDDLLMPRTSALALRAPAEIRGELRKACNAIWRADNRGNTAAKKLREQLKAARHRLGEAQARDRELRDARTERAEIEAELEALRERKRELEREHAVASFLGTLFEWNQRRRALGAEVDLAGLGDRRLVRPSELDAEIEEHETLLRAPRARLAYDALSLGDAAAQVLARSTEIERACADLSDWNADRERLAEQKQAAAKARERARDELRAALGGDPSASQLEAVANLPIEALASTAAEWSDARDREFNGAASASGHARVWQAVAGCAGIALIGLGVFAQLDTRLIFTGALLLIAALLVGAFARPRSRGQSAAAPPELARLCGEVVFPDALLVSPAALQRLVGLLVGIQHSLTDARERERLSEQLEVRIRERESSWAALCQHIGVEAEADGRLLVARLRAALEAASAESASLERDRSERDEARRLIEFEQPVLENSLAHRERLHAVLRAAEPECGNLNDAFDRVEQRRSEMDFLRRRRSELSSDARYAAFESDPRVVGDRAPEAAPWLPEVRAAADVARSELEERLSAKQHRLGQLTELLGGDSAGAVSDASDAVRETREEIAASERKRDRLALLESILARAERDFRELHQPDVLRRASNYLERITDGRYHRIDLLDGDAGRLGVSLAGRGEPIEVAQPISQGTLDQIFLCLRLGMLDHLDEGRERLPLILDDALLRMDDLRRREAYALLGEMAPTRQVWILTCNRALADEIQTALDVSRIDL